MAVVSEKLSGQFGGDITSDIIWGKLRTMFDLTAVDDREEVIPFTIEEREFSLPRRDFHNLIVEKQKEINKDKSAGKSNKLVSRVAPDMGSDAGAKKEKEIPKQQVKVESKMEAKEELINTKSAPAKRHVTRSTPNNTPAKKEKEIPKQQVKVE